MHVCFSRIERIGPVGKLFIGNTLWTMKRVSFSMLRFLCTLSIYYISMDIALEKCVHDDLYFENEEGEEELHFLVDIFTELKEENKKCFVA